MTRFALLLSAFATLTTACGREDDSDVATAELAVDSADAAQTEGALLAANLDGVEAAASAGLTAPSPEGVATWIATHAAARYQPAGCAVVAQTGASVTITLTGCTGPRGLRELTGVLDLTAQPSAGGAIEVTAHAADLQVGGATMDLDSTAIYTVNGTTHSVAVTTHGTGIGPLGNDVTREGDYTTTWDSGCVSVDGSWATTIGARGRSTTVSLERCQGTCPTGTATHARLDGRTLSITFDGTSTAQWTSSSGRSGTTQLRCGQ